MAGPLDWNFQNTSYSWAWQLNPTFGIDGFTSYYFLRVAQQYCMLQEIPPSLKSGFYHFDFRNKVVKRNQIESLKREVASIINIQNDCPPRDIDWANDLESEKKEHHALRDYIRRHIGLELKVVVPDVSLNPTPKQTQMEHVIREGDKALAKVERLAQKTKPLRRILCEPIAFWSFDHIPLELFFYALIGCIRIFFFHFPRYDG